ncbi:MAG: hypothetical protein ACTSRP_23315, partial [Candidatus Helarchaeota archaeon]
MDSNREVHLLVVGHSHGHIYKVIEYFRPDEIIFFSTKELINEINNLIGEIEKLGIKTYMRIIDPFKNDSILRITHLMVEEGKKILKKTNKSHLKIG